MVLIMKVTYHKALNAYKIIYKDAIAEAQGKKHPYVRKQISAGRVRPRVAEIKARIRELEHWAEKQEQALLCVATRPGTPAEAADTPLLAAPYIRNLSGQDLTTTLNAKERRRAAQLNESFIDFLESNHPGIYLHQINKKIALEYAQWLNAKNVSFAYKKARWMRLGYVFNIINIKFEESTHKYRNPFYSLKIDKIAVEEPVNHKKTFTPELIRLILKEARKYNATSKPQPHAEKIQRWAILYLLALTGIRPKDIYLLTWDQLNLSQRTLTITHTKTAKKGIKTIIWLTPHLMDIFHIMKILHSKYEPRHKKYIFSFYSGRESSKDIEHYLLFTSSTYLSHFFQYFRQKYNLDSFVFIGGKKQYDYSIYSLRATVGTLLTWANFNQNSIDYLQGHSPNNTTARFYLNHEANPRAATEDMINHLACNITQQHMTSYGLALARHDAEQQQLRLEAERNRLTPLQKQTYAALLLPARLHP